MSPTKRNTELPGAARLFGTLIGPAILLLLALSIAGRNSGWFSPHSVAFLFVSMLAMLVRWYEFGRNPTTSTGEHATPADLRKFLISSVVAGLGL